ncbi:MAG: hypothetical protein GX434_06525 [Peptococcaceae bacterium]|nr:hypothetical protein [Peptococcaceae bacterium]
MVKGFSENVRRILDHLSLERIIVLGGLSVLLTALFLFAGLMIPLGLQTEERLMEGNSLRAQIRELEFQHKETSKLIPQSADLPAAVSDLRDRFLANGFQIEEILLTPMSDPGKVSLHQTGIRIIVTGEKAAVFTVLTEAQKNNGFPFLVQEIDIKDSRIEIQARILLAGSNKMVNSGT